MGWGGGSLKLRKKKKRPGMMSLCSFYLSAELTYRFRRTGLPSLQGSTFRLEGGAASCTRLVGDVFSPFFYLWSTVHINWETFTNTRTHTNTKTHISGNLLHVMLQLGSLKLMRSYFIHKHILKLLDSQLSNYLGLICFTFVTSYKIAYNFSGYGM